MVDVKASPSQRRRSVEASESFDSFNKTSDSLSTSELIDPLGKISIWSVVHISETTEEEEERNISRYILLNSLKQTQCCWFDLIYIMNEPMMGLCYLGSTLLFVPGIL